MADDFNGHVVTIYAHTGPVAMEITDQATNYEAMLEACKRYNAIHGPGKAEVLTMFIAPKGTAKP